MQSLDPRSDPAHPIQTKLNQVSGTFCVAKWKQVTLRLQNGFNHSCHHPKAHKIPAKGLLKNPAALHNTPFKKLARKQMLEGVRPPECSYCWKVEDLPGNQVSDRFIKSNDDWAKPHIETLAKTPWQEDVKPSYIEVSFSNACNFACAYCSPDVSSMWMQEVKKFGPYPTSLYFGGLPNIARDSALPLPAEGNPYIAAFWKWLPEIIGDLEFLRVTGGEPLMSKDTFKLLEYLDTHPAPRLNFSINSNLGVAPRLIKKALGQLKDLKNSNKIKEAHVFTSIDTWGPQAEYIRHGLDAKLWETQLEEAIVEFPEIKYTIMVTYNLLSPFHFMELLKFVQRMKAQHRAHLSLDISILHDPKFLNVLLLPKGKFHYLQQQYDFMIASQKEPASSFSVHEIAKMKRLLEYIKTTSLKPKELRLLQIDFIAFILEYDHRKRLNFLNRFPEFSEDFLKWSELHNRRNPLVGIKIKGMSWLRKIIGQYLLQ